RQVAAYIERNGQQLALFEENTPTRRFFLKRHEPARTLTFEAGKSKAPTLKEGKARLVVETVSNDLRSRSRRHGGPGRAARRRRRCPALHQPGRHGTRHLHSRRLLERSRRAGRQVH